VVIARFGEPESEPRLRLLDNTLGKSENAVLLVATSQFTVGEVEAVKLPAEALSHPVEAEKLPPSPPREAAKVPDQVGVYTCALPDETIVNPKLVSLLVENVCAPPLKPLSEEIPLLPVPVIQVVPSVEKQVALTPPAKVEVAVEVAVKRDATTSPTTESLAYGLLVPMPTLPAKLL
jgi:hypothetical protein